MKPLNLSSEIVSAAMLMDDGLIVSGVRHFSPDMRAVLHRIYGDGYHLRVNEQGFVNTRGEFLDRADALIVAKHTGQFRPIVSGPSERELYSENLY